ncbi:MAG: ParB/RepB/Spo0J family partition protein [Candidatus Tectomicrobia bacterium]|nr:ParB/RepB/Spo0J family partition protein [Candidatus Tectomicrobia bacterium]
MQRKALGKGLAALLPEIDLGLMPGGEAGAAVGPYRDIPLARIGGNPLQPRTQYSEEKLEELAASIRAQGIVQPVLVRPAAGREGFYELLAGERRLLAAERAGLTAVPAIVRPADDHEALELALIENLQREDLNPMDEARAYRILMEQFQLTQEEVAERLSKDRSSVTNMLRLLRLPDEVRGYVADGRLSLGHAKVLLGLEAPARQVELARRIVSGGLSVRDAERRARKLLPGREQRRERQADEMAVYLERLERHLQEKFGTKVRVQGSGRRGKLIFEYYSAEDLERLIGMLSV